MISTEEIRLKCLELAMEQAKREGEHANRAKVVEIAQSFYDHIMSESPAGKKGLKAKADKSLFE